MFLNINIPFAWTIPSTPINSSGRKNRKLNSLLLNSSRMWKGLLKWHWKSQLPQSRSLQVLHLITQDMTGLSQSAQNDLIGMLFFSMKHFKKSSLFSLKSSSNSCFRDDHIFPFLFTLLFSVNNIISNTFWSLQFCFKIFSLLFQNCRP